MKAEYGTGGVNQTIEDRRAWAIVIVTCLGRTTGPASTSARP